MQKGAKTQERVSWYEWANICVIELGGEGRKWGRKKYLKE